MAYENTPISVENVKAYRINALESLDATLQDRFSGGGGNITKPATEQEFQKMSWADVNALASSAKSYPSQFEYMIGWKRPITLKSPFNITVDFEIVDVAHDDYRIGGILTHGFVFMATKVLRNQAYLNSNGTTAYNYSQSQIHYSLTNDIYLAFPSDLIAVWKVVNYKYFNQGTTSTWSGKNAVSLNTYLCLPSLAELGLLGSVSTGTGDYSDEGRVFKKFSGASNTDRLRYDTNGTVKNYWLRSLVNASTYFMGYITTSGSLSYANQFEEYGIVPVFCV